MLYYAVPEIGKHCNASYTPVRPPQFFSKYNDYV